MTCFSGVCVREMRTTLAPMLVCPLPSQGMDAETGICGGAKGTELAWAMFVWEDRWSMSSELQKTKHSGKTITENILHHWGHTESEQILQPAHNLQPFPFITT